MANANILDTEFLTINRGGTLQINPGGIFNVSPGAIVNFPIDIQFLLWQSDVITATGSAQNIPTTLGAVPSGVLVSAYNTQGLGVLSTTYNITEGTHTADYVQITATALLQYKVIAWGATL